MAEVGQVKASGRGMLSGDAQSDSAVGRSRSVATLRLVSVLCEPIDLTAYRDLPAKAYSEQLVVGWIGSPSTTSFLHFALEPLRRLCAKYSNLVLRVVGRDLGAGPARTFFRVTLPLSRPGILAALVIVSLPMFGDYYTNNLLSQSPKTTMLGNLIDEAYGSTGQGPRAAVFVLILMVLLIIPMLYYLRSTSRSLLTR